MDIIIPALLLVAGIVLVIKGADFLVDGSSALALRFNLAEIVAGLTIVALGTSAPELVINVFSSIQNKSDIVLGNIIGSNISNILLILGISGLIRPIIVSRHTLMRDIPFSLAVTILLFVMVCGDLITRKGGQDVSRTDGIILLAALIVFVVFVLRFSRTDTVVDIEAKPQTLGKSVLIVIFGFTGLFAGGKLVVDNAIVIARLLNVSEKLIALTIVSVGTSLPELATSVVAAYKGRSGIVVGNILGSNIYNVLFVLGISAVINPVTYDQVFNTDIIVLLCASLFLLLAMFTGRRRTLERWESFIFFVSYVAYISFIIYRQ